MHCAELPDVRAAATADARCISDDAVALNNGEFAARVRSVAGLLAQRGVRRGDVVATLLSNRVELVLTLFAAWRLGAAVTPINPALTDSEAAYQLEDSAARMSRIGRSQLVHGHVQANARGVVLVPDIVEGHFSSNAPLSEMFVGRVAHDP